MTKFNKSTETSCGTYVYIWKTTSKRVGHVGIEIVDCDSNGNEISKKYSSIHPGLIPAIGPTIALPLPAALSKSLQEDMETEAAYTKPSVDPFDTASSSFTKEEPSKHLAPDYAFHFTDLNTNTMLAFMKKEEIKVESGDTSYQLFPKVNAMRFFKEMPSYFNYNPIDIKETRKSADTQKNGVYNCATFVNRILNEGGLPAKESKTPWGQSPNGLAEQLFKLQNS